MFVVFESRCQGRAWNDAHCLPSHTTAPPASVVKNTHTLPQTRIYWAHHTTPFEGEWQRFIWQAKATLQL